MRIFTTLRRIITEISAISGTNTMGEASSPIIVADNAPEQLLRELSQPVLVWDQESLRLDHRPRISTLPSREMEKELVRLHDMRHRVSPGAVEALVHELYRERPNLGCQSLASRLSSWNRQLLGLLRAQTSRQIPDSSGRGSDAEGTLFEVTLRSSPDTKPIRTKSVAPTPRRQQQHATPTHPTAYILGYGLDEGVFVKHEFAKSPRKRRAFTAARERKKSSPSARKRRETLRHAETRKIRPTNAKARGSPTFVPKSSPNKRKHRASAATSSTPKRSPSTTRKRMRKQTPGHETQRSPGLTAQALTSQGDSMSQSPAPQRSPTSPAKQLPRDAAIDLQALAKTLLALDPSDVPIRLFDSDQAVGNGTDDAVESPQMMRLRAKVSALFLGDNTTQDNFNAACAALGSRIAGRVSDEAFVVLCRLVVTRVLSTARCKTFLSKVVLPRASSLRQTVSRVMFLAVAHIAALHPLPVVSALLVPLMQSPNASSVHSDMCKRVFGLEALSASARASFVASLVSLSPAQSSLPAAEARASVLLELLSGGGGSTAGSAGQGMRRGVHMRREVSAVLVEWIRAAVKAHPKSLKISNVLFRLIQHHPDVTARHHAELVGASESVKTFMRKAIQNKLAKLKDRSSRN